MNTFNPVVETTNLNTSKRLESTVIKYPIKVYCIVDDLSEAGRDPIIRNVKSYVINSGAMFITREYDSRKFSNDRDVIQRLPAFHVHINKAYNRTFYPNTRPLDHINECIELYIKNEEAKIKRKGRWRKLYESFKKWVNNFKWRRETALEKYDREHITNTNKSRFDSIQNNKVPISNWN
jgi:hypothetical protein